MALKYSKSVSTLFLFLAMLYGAHANAQTADYRIRTRDVIHVNVEGERDLSLDLTVLDDGTISYPYAGRLTADGMTLEDLQNKLATALKKIIKDPRVTITVAHSRPTLASGVGVLFKPATVPFQPRQTLLDLIAQCQGLSPTTRPEWVHAQLIRAGTVIPIDYVKLSEGDKNENRELQDGDILVVNENDIDAKSVKVVGEIAKPGAYPVGKKLTFASLLAQAGGPTLHGSLKSAILTHGLIAKPVDLSQILKDGKEPAGIEIRAGDTLLIPASVAHFLVVGAVRLPGIFDLPENDRVDLLSALSRTGGMDPEADLRWVYILRHASLADASKSPLAAVPEKIDMKTSLLDGHIAGIQLHEGDVVYVPFRKTPVGIKDLTGVIGAAIISFLH